MKLRNQERNVVAMNSIALEFFEFLNYELAQLLVLVN